MDNTNLNKQTEIEEKQSEVVGIEAMPLEIQDQYFVRTPKGMVAGGFMEFFGFSFAMLFCVLLIGVIALDSALHGVSLLLVPMIIFAFASALLFLMGVKGRQMRKRIRRFLVYKQTLAGRELCDIEELAEVIEKSQEFVVSDLKDMFERGWFLQGHIDLWEKHLIVTDTMNEQYTLAMMPKKNK